MKVEFLDRFNKDSSKIRDRKILNDVAQVIESAKHAGNISDLKNLKKLKGDKNAYRFRIGDYRIGVYIEKDTIEFARLAHRKDIYNLFP